MLPSTETIDQALSELRALPPPSCPDVDKVLRRLQSEERDADRAARATTDEAARTDLEAASSAINTAAVALDEERDIAAALRAGCDSRESIARTAIRACEDRDVRIQTLEAEVGEREGIIDIQANQLDTRQRVITHLGAQIKASWWTKMANATKRLWWERRAKGMKKRIRRLDDERAILKLRNNDLFDGLLLADGVLAEMEWEEGPFGEKVCPHCHAMDGSGIFARPPRHENGCRIGQACEVIRWALRCEAREHGLDPRHVGNGRREFQT